MSSDKFTSRGFGASGAGRSSWSPPRDSYKAPVDKGSSFLFGGAGLRGSPHAGRQQRPIPQAGNSQFSAQANRLDEPGSSLQEGERSRRAPAIDLSGGDITTTSLQRRGLFVALFVVALVLSVVMRACAGGASDTSWIRERRSHIQSNDE
ncbi:MAG: hypothetical protein RL518_2787 [Pseudomonadota bacterium]|jgi:hypothetical protein